MQSLVDYYGSKWRLAPTICSLMPNSDHFLDLFGGSGAVLYHKPRSKNEFWNDLNGDLFNLMRVCREQGEALVRLLQLTPYSRSEFELAKEPCDEPVERARRFLVRHKMAWGNKSGSGLYFRSSVVRDRRTSYAQDWARFPASVALFVGRFRGVVVESMDFRELLLRHSGALVYADPPYLRYTRSSAITYGHDMSEQDHVELLELALQHNGPFVISCYDSELYSELLRGWVKVVVGHSAGQAEICYLNQEVSQR